MTENRRWTLISDQVDYGRGWDWNVWTDAKDSPEPAGMDEQIEVIEAKVTDEMVRVASAEIEKTFLFMGFPGTRAPGTECVDCEEIARIALEKVLGS